MFLGKSGKLRHHRPKLCATVDRNKFFANRPTKTPLQRSTGNVQITSDNIGSRTKPLQVGCKFYLSMGWRWKTLRTAISMDWKRKNGDGLFPLNLHITSDIT